MYVRNVTPTVPDASARIPAGIVSAKQWQRALSRKPFDRRLELQTRSSPLAGLVAELKTTYPVACDDLCPPQLRLHGETPRCYNIYQMPGVCVLRM